METVFDHINNIVEQEDRETGEDRNIDVNAINRQNIITNNSDYPEPFTVINADNELFHGSYITYSNTDVYGGMENHVLPRETEFNNVVLEAARRGCIVIVRKGAGQWYLKGYGKDYVDTKQRIENNLVTEALREEGAKIHRNVQVWLLQIRVGIAVFNEGTLP